MTRDETAQLARVTALLENMDERQQREYEERREAERVAAQHREELQQKQAETAAEVKHIHRRLDEIEPVTQMVTSVRSKLVGAGIILGALGAVVIGAWTTFKDETAQIINFLTGR